MSWRFLTAVLFVIVVTVTIIAHWQDLKLAQRHPASVEVPK
jgi:hypothetical protein